MAGKLNAFLVGIGVFLMVVAGVLTIRLVSADSPPDRDVDAYPTSGKPTPSRSTTTTPQPSASPTPGVTLLPSPTPPRTTAPPTTTISTPPTWNLVWTDEFDSLNGSRWSLANNVVDNDACMLSPSVIVASGLLALRAERLTDPLDCAGQPKSYTSAHVATIAAFTYGAFEVLAKSPNVDATTLGLWPSIWLGAADGNGAIDVAAFNGGPGYANASLAVYCSVNQQSTVAVSGGTAGGYHRYRLEWESGVLRWYVDGSLVWTRDASTTPGFASFFAKPYRLHLSFPVGGSGGDPSGATLPADFEIQSVSVYQR